MTLTDKCQHDFEGWYRLPTFAEMEQHDKGITYIPLDFEELPLSMQYGVYVNFFR